MKTTAKTILALLLVLAFIIPLAGCGGNTGNTETSSSPTATVEPTEEVPTETITPDADDPTDAPEPTEAETPEPTDTPTDEPTLEPTDEPTLEPTVEPTPESTDTEWKQFLKEYEAWVDRYVKLLKKYQDNPADMTIMSDYMEMLGEMAEWSEKAGDIEADLVNDSAALKEYLDTLTRIINKLSDIG